MNTRHYTWLRLKRKSFHKESSGSLSQTLNFSRNVAISPPNQDDPTISKFLNQSDIVVAMEEVSLGKYRHYKGDSYRVLGVARHSETLEELVMYECLYDNPRSMLWVRPKDMFLETVMVHGKETPRFAFIGE